MFCKNCGTKLDEGNNFCTNCGKPIVVGHENPQEAVENNLQINSTNKQQVNNEKNKESEMSIEDTNNAKILCILSVVLTYFSSAIVAVIAQEIPSLEKVLASLAGLSPLVGIVLMIVARVKYPKYKPAKIIMWIDIIMLIAGIIGFIILVAVCYFTCSSLGSLG